MHHVQTHFYCIKTDHYPNSLCGCGPRPLRRADQDNSGSLDKNELRLVRGVHDFWLCPFLWEVWRERHLWRYPSALRVALYGVTTSSYGVLSTNPLRLWRAWPFTCRLSEIGSYCWLQLSYNFIAPGVVFAQTWPQFDGTRGSRRN